MSGLKPLAVGVVVAVACLASLAFGVEPAFAASPLDWSAPALIDHQAPFSDYQHLSDVSCPSASECVAIDGNGRRGHLDQSHRGRR